MNIDPNLSQGINYIYATRQLNVGLYQNPQPSAKASVFDHSSLMAEDCGNFTGNAFGHEHGTLKWCVLNACNLNSLEWITLWVSNFSKQCSNVRPVVYITYEKWAQIIEGLPDAVTVIGNLLLDADMCMSKFYVKKPVLPSYANQLNFWEYSLNYLQYEETGIACSSEFESTIDTADESSTDTTQAKDTTTTTNQQSSISALAGLFQVNTEVTIKGSILSRILGEPVTITTREIKDEEE
jgi:hypothetical protein